MNTSLSMRTVFAILATLSLCLFGGCNQSAPTVGPAGVGPSAPIPLAVWRIQKFNDSLTSPANNVGCRMPDADITLIVRDLTAKSRSLSPNCVLTWDGYIGRIFSPWVTQRPELWSVAGIAATDFYFDTGDGWNPDAINVYFVGDCQFQTAPYPTNIAVAATLDPRVAPTVSLVPHIFVNDQGFNAASGYLSGFSAAGVNAQNGIPHELCHYLARFTNRSFAGSNPNRSYSGGEHVPQVAYNLMRPTLPVPLVVPGTPADSASEKGEINDRIFNSLWNSP